MDDALEKVARQQDEITNKLLMINEATWQKIKESIVEELDEAKDLYDRISQQYGELSDELNSEAIATAEAEQAQ